MTETRVWSCLQHCYKDVSELKVKYDICNKFIYTVEDEMQLQPSSYTTEDKLNLRELHAELFCE